MDEATARAETESVRAAILRQLRFSGSQMIRSMTLRDRGAIDLIFLPVMGPVRVVSEVGKAINQEGVLSVWKVPFRLVQKKGGVIAGAVVLNYINGQLSIDQVEFDRETNDFMQQIGKRPYVFVNFMAPTEDLATVAKWEFENKYQHLPRTHYVEATSFEDLLTKLQAVEKVEGEVFGLQVVSHGLPGDLRRGDIKLSEEIRKRLDRRGSFPLAAGGQIKLNSCFTGLGTKGEDFVQDLGRYFLTKGGDIYSSRVVIHSELRKKQRAEGDYLWPTASALGGPNTFFTAVAGLMQGASVIRGGGTELGIFDPVRATHIDPRSD
ncbi:MAG: hypothetical protein AB7P04_02245 [Bacteriovoracia bacterium]